MHYYRFANGSYTEVTVVGYDHDPNPPEGGVEVSADEYATGLSVIEEANATYVAQVRAVEQEQQDADYTELRKAGISESTARRLCGTPTPLDLPALPNLVGGK